MPFVVFHPTPLIFFPMIGTLLKNLFVNQHKNHHVKNANNA